MFKLQILMPQKQIIGFRMELERHGLLGLQWLGSGDARPRFHGPVATREQIADILRIDSLLTDRASVLPPSKTSRW